MKTIEYDTKFWQFWFFAETTWTLRKTVTEILRKFVQNDRKSLKNGWISALRTLEWNIFQENSALEQENLASW